MKKIAWLCIILTVFSYTIPLRVRAAAPAIGLIGAAAIGATVLAAGGTQYAQKQGGSYGFNGSHITRDMIAYTSNKLTQQTLDQIAAAQGMAQDAGGYVIGKAVQGVFDLSKAFSENVLSSYSNLYSTVQDFFSSNAYDEPTVSEPNLPIGTILKTPDGRQIRITYDRGIRNVSNPSVSQGVTVFSTYIQYRYDYRVVGSKIYATFHEYDFEYVVVPVEVPEVLDPDMETPLAGAIVDAAKANPGVSKDLDSLMQSRPDLWAFPDSASLPSQTAPGSKIEDYPPAWPITPSQITAWSASQGIAAQQSLVDRLEGLVAANPSDISLQNDLAREKSRLEQMQAAAVNDISKAEAVEQAAADQAVSEDGKPETFETLETSVSWDPYNPGEFDIPARFTAMLNTVKGTALFSFSSGFFESLPTGGSSLVTFEGGDTFGNHTVDLSDTLETGLIAFRAVVMVIFGFLAIRAVIMKR